VWNVFIVVGECIYGDFGFGVICLSFWFYLVIVV